jgi:predicted kinase
VRLNKDALRKELYGDEAAVGVLKDVNALFYRRLEEALQNGRNVLIDNTNVSTLHRKGPLAMAHQHGYTRVTHLFLDVPLEECLRRNSLRDRKVPEEALIELADALTWKGSVPTRREGHLVVLKPGRTVGEFLVDRVRMHGDRRVKIRQG